MGATPIYSGNEVASALKYGSQNTHLRAILELDTSPRSLVETMEKMPSNDLVAARDFLLSARSEQLQVVQEGVDAKQVLVDLIGNVLESRAKGQWNYPVGPGARR